MKRILITGASSGIGRAVAMSASQSGWHVIACGRDKARLAELEHERENIVTLAFDLNDIEACRQSMRGTRPDVVLINAGTCEYVDVDQWDSGLFRRVFEGNVMSAVNTIDAVLPELASEAQLVFVDSLARLLPFTRSQAYGSSKAALHYLAKSLEVDLRDRRIRVQTISPGFVRTPLTGNNEFGMPMLMEPGAAARSILSAIQKGKRSTFFPTAFAAVIRCLSALPESTQAWLCHRLSRQHGGA